MAATATHILFSGRRAAAADPRSPGMVAYPPRAAHRRCSAQGHTFTADHAAVCRHRVALCIRRMARQDQLSPSVAQPIRRRSR